MHESRTILVHFIKPRRLLYNSCGVFILQNFIDKPEKLEYGFVNKFPYDKRNYSSNLNSLHITLDLNVI